HIVRPCSAPSDASRQFFFFKAPPPTEIYPLSLHDALPILAPWARDRRTSRVTLASTSPAAPPLCSTAISRGHWKKMVVSPVSSRSEEHTSELQSRENLVCRLLLEKKKKNKSRATLERRATR